MSNKYLPKILIFVIIIVLSVLFVIKQTSIPATDKTNLSPTIYPTPTYKPTAYPTPTYNPEDNIVPESILPQTLPSGWSRWLHGYPYAQQIYYPMINSNTRTTATFQLNDSEYFKTIIGAQSLSIIKETKTNKGTNIYIIKSYTGEIPWGNIYVSSCKPTENLGYKGESACSIPFKNKLLFISLQPITPGDQAVKALNFNDPKTNSLIADFIKIIESSNF